jgi:hypothetical protein
MAHPIRQRQERRDERNLAQFDTHVETDQRQQQRLLRSSPIISTHASTILAYCRRVERWDDFDSLLGKRRLVADQLATVPCVLPLRLLGFRFHDGLHDLGKRRPFCS